MANFIDRPIFAWVIAILTVLMGGGLALSQLPVAQYPTIAPPTVTIAASYPGRLGRYGREFGDAGHRAVDAGPRRPPGTCPPRATPTATPRSR